MQLAFRIDGSTASGFAASILSSDFELQSSAAAQLTLDLYDLNSADYEAGAPQLGIEFAAGTAVDGGAYPTGDGYTTVGHGVRLTARTPTDASWTWSGNDTYNYSVPWTSPALHTFDVDTGLVSFSLATFVGNQLRLEGSLLAGLRCSTYSATATAPSCSAMSDYGSTFDAELSANVAGVAFSD